MVQQFPRMRLAAERPEWAPNYGLRGRRRSLSRSDFLDRVGETKSVPLVLATVNLFSYEQTESRAHENR